MRTDAPAPPAPTRRHRAARRPIPGRRGGGAAAPRLRRLTTGEEDVLIEVFDGLTPRSRYLRFHAPVRHLAPAARSALAAIDGVDHVAVVAEVPDGDRLRPVGIGRLVRTDPGVAELAIEVVDDHQAAGLGRRLVTALHEVAKEMGLERVISHVLPENGAMLHLLDSVFPGSWHHPDGSSLLVTSPVGAVPIVTHEDMMAALM